MKLKNAASILFALALCLSTSLCYLIGHYVKNSAGDEIYIMSMKKDRIFFSRDSIALLEKEQRNFTFTEKLYMEVSSGIAKFETEIIGTNENFANMTQLNIVSGSFFNEMHIKKRSKVVVLNSEAASQFFGNVQSVGNFISIGIESYEVIGVTQNDLNYDNAALLYMPLENINRYVSNSPAITEIWINLRDISEAGLIIALLGYSSDDVRILQMEQYKDIVMQRFNVIIFIAGLTIIIILWKRTLRSMKILWQVLTAFFKENYVSSILFVFKRDRFLKELFLSILNLLAALMLLKIISFKVCIPSNDLMAGCSAFTVLSNLLDVYMQPNIGVSSLQYLNSLNMASNILFFASILFGVAFAYSLRPLLNTAS